MPLMNSPLLMAAPAGGSAGQLWSWGRGGQGRLGLGNTTSYSSPKQVGALTTWARVSVGGYAMAAVKTDGTLWTWGDNTTGQLGLGNLTNYSSPKQVGALTNWLSVSMSYASCAAIKTDGTLWTWGANNNGQLGLGNTTTYSSPKQVGALTTWASIAATGQAATATFIGAIKTDGTLWTWGVNNVGQLGLGNLTNYSSPKQVGALTTWSKVFCITGNMFAIKTDGTLWAWGQNTAGVLGLGNTTAYSSPKQVGALTTWATFPNGCSPNSFIQIIKSDGSLWAWGNNATYGQLGLGNTTSYSSPVQVGAVTTWISAAIGQQFTLAIRT